MVFSLLLFVAILFSDEQDSGISNIHYGGVNVSAEVLAHKPMVEKYAKEYGVEEYVNILLAIIQVESGGTAEDVMQSSESLGLPPNSLSTEESIKQGVKYFSELLASSERLSVDLESVIQSYNYGGGFLGYVANRGNKYTFELAQSFSKEYSGGEKVSYPNPIAIPINGGWRYNYGNMFYVQLVTQYLVTTEFDDDTVQAIMDEALKYEGWRYVYGGASPTTSFDCSGLTQWTYGKAGINLPRTAQQQPPRGHDAQARHPAPALLRPPQARLWDGRPALCGMHRRRPGLRHCICDFHLELQINAQNPLTV